MESLIYMITPTAASVAANGVLPLTTIARRLGRAITNGSNSVVLNVPGYYEINVTETFTAPAAGTVTLKLQRGSEDIPGATASTTITTATTEVRSLSYSTIVRVLPFGPVTITALNSGVAINISNIGLTVKYLG